MSQNRKWHDDALKMLFVEPAIGLAVSVGVFLLLKELQEDGTVKIPDLLELALSAMGGGLVLVCMISWHLKHALDTLDEGLSQKIENLQHSVSYLKQGIEEPIPPNLSGENLTSQRLIQIWQKGILKQGLLKSPSHFLATNYTNHDHWETIFTEKTFEIQAFLTKHCNMKIERIYIVHDLEEKDKIMSELNKFGDLGQDSYYIEYSKIEMPEDLKGLSKDFGIFNNAILEWHLGDDRRLIGGKIIIEDEKRKKYQELYNYIKGNARCHKGNAHCQ